MHREGNQFVLTEGSYVAAVPPKKKSKKRVFAGGGGKRRPPSKRPGSRPKPNLSRDDGAKVEKPNVVKVGNGGAPAEAADSSAD